MALTLVRYMESHFQEELASFEDKTKARAQVIHVFQYGGSVALNQQVVSLRQPHEIEAILVVRTTQNFSKWPGIQPEMVQHTTEIEYVLVPRTQQGYFQLQPKFGRKMLTDAILRSYKVTSMLWERCLPEGVENSKFQIGSKQSNKQAEKRNTKKRR